MNRITVLGAGHWGLALASVLASNECEVLVYARNELDTMNLNLNHKSKHFEDFTFSNLIKGTSNLEEAINFSDIIVVSIPVVAITSVLYDVIDNYKNKTIVLTSKGLSKGRSISTLLKERNKDLKVAVLYGPSFSTEVVLKKKTAVVIASSDINLAKELQTIFNNNYFRVYTTTDVIGVEYCGAIKNVFAIVCGMVDGNDMGTNAKNAILTRGLSEMNRIISFVGGDPKTLFGLAGIGDIMLTCNSLESRNYSYGYYYPNETLGTVEGLNTINEIYNISKDNNIEMPIINSLYQILHNGSDIFKEAENLMGRNLKSE